MNSLFLKIYNLFVNIQALHGKMWCDKELDSQEKSSEKQVVYASRLEHSSLRCLRIITSVFALSKYQKIRVAQFTVSYASAHPAPLPPHCFRKEKTKKIVKLQSAPEKG